MLMRILFILLFPLFVFGQGKNNAPLNLNPIDQHKCVSSFGKIKIHATDKNTIEQVRNYLIAHLKNLQFEKMGLKFLEDKESPAARHVTFQQTYNSKPVYAATIKVNLNQEGDIISILDNSFEISQTLSSDFASEEIINSHILSYASDVKIEWEKNYLYNGEALLPLIKFKIFENPSKYYDLFMDAKGEKIYERDLLKYDKSHATTIASIDTIVTADVFLPDPLTTAIVEYGSPYVDSNDVDIAVLTSQLKNVTISVSYLSGTFSLDGPYAVVKELESPTVAPVTSTIPDFSFTRANNGFEDVNAYYNITNQHAHYQNLGFGSLVNYPIQVDAHAMFGDDNSSFAELGTSSELLFGEGGIDDAEDADVILHEYGHATLSSATLNATNGNEMNAIDEANGDYLAASYSRSLNSYNWQRIFSWDGHNEFWEGRMVETTKHYPDDLVGNLYTDAPIWSSTLMQIWGDIGRDTTDQLLLQSMYSFSNGMTMSDAASIYLQADSLMYGGKHAPKIYTRFCMRGFWTCDSALVDTTITKANVNLTKNDKQEVKIAGTDLFAIGEKGTIVNWVRAENVTIHIYSSNGKLVFSDQKAKVTTYTLPQLSLASGMYILRVSLPNSTICFKLAKY